MRLATKSLTTLTANIILFSLGFVNSIVIARVLGPEGKGYYAFIVFIFSLAITTLGFGLPFTNPFFVASEKAHESSVIANSLIINIFGTLIFGLITLFIITFKSTLLNKIDIFGFFLIAITIPFGLFQKSLFGILIGKDKIPLVNLLTVLTGAAVIFNLIFLITHLLNRHFAIIGWGLAQMVTCITAIWLLRKNFSFQFNGKLIRSMLKYGIPQWISTLIGFFTLRPDMIVAGVMLSLKDIGIYSLAFMLAGLLGFIPSSVGLAATPNYAKHKRNEVISLAFSTVRKSFIIMTGLGLFGALVGKWVIPFIWGEKFVNSYLLFIILLPGFLFFNLQHAISGFTYYHISHDIFWKTAVFSLLFFIPSALFFVPLLGIYGLAVSTSVSCLLSAILYGFLVQKYLGISILPFLKITHSDFTSLTRQIKHIAYRSIKEKN